MYTQVDRTNAYEAVRDQLLASIEDGTLEVGDKLPPESKLAGEFGVSRPVVREALGSLRALGLVRSVSGSGTFVAASKPALILGRYSMSELDYVRSCLEIPAARQAARLCDAQSAQRLTQCFTDLSQCHDADSWSSLDSALHLEIAKATGNRVLVDLTEHLSDALHELSSSLVGAKRREMANAEHKLILDAILAGDEEAASAAMANHLASVRQFVMGMQSGDEVWFGFTSADSRRQDQDEACQG